MSPDTSPSASLPEPSPTAPAKPHRNGRPTFWEDLIVTGIGFASSTGVAWLSWWMAANWDFAVYTWMAYYILPVGALICGFAAATGYWVGARLFNHRPSRGLLFNIILVSFTTFFAIHHFHYSNDKISGRSISNLMTFTDYLVEVTEHMTYKSSRSRDSDAGTELGKLGWGVAALQIIGFSMGGFAVYGMLTGVPYCDRCAKYLSEKKTRAAKWKDVAAWQPGFEELATLMQEGRLQALVDAHASMGEDRRLRIGSMLFLELRKCPACENRRLKLTGQQRNGNQWAVVATAEVKTEEPLELV